MICIAIGRVVWIGGLTFKVFATEAEARQWANKINQRRAAQ